MQRAGQTSTAPGIEGADLRAILRAGTRASHEALDARLGAMVESPDDGLYRRFIAMSAAAFDGLMPPLLASPLAAVPGALAPLAAGRAALVADVAAMAIALPRGLPAFPIARPDLAEAAGIAYVLEGSKLGARYLHRRIVGADGRPRWPGAATAYLAEAEDAGPFPAYLSLLARTGAGDAATLRAAGATFRHFAAVLDAVEHMAASPTSLEPGKAR